MTFITPERPRLDHFSAMLNREYQCYGFLPDPRRFYQSLCRSIDSLNFCTGAGTNTVLYRVATTQKLSAWSPDNPAPWEYPPITAVEEFSKVCYLHASALLIPSAD
jgi:hypothetical protein